ncbi:MAG: bile acid:sodium symporter family protein [Cyclobacteriaceae bacterium]|nr:bile acid:sodium symporter family protein [Cyclobacteriaceae bacterium]
MLEELQLNFNEDNLLMLNIALAIIMFGVALSLEIRNFKALLQKPKALLTGVSSQFILLPLLTFLLILLIDPLPGLALGMILVAACPGGNVSNFYTSLAKGNVELSVLLTVIASILAVFLTPINFKFWASHLDNTPELFSNLEVDFWKMVSTILFVLVIPLISGLLVANKLPTLTKIIVKPIKILSIVILATIIVFSFVANIDIFKQYYTHIVYLVLIHNAVALVSAYFYSRLLGNEEHNSITVSMETGIQNSALGLVLIFNFFDGNGAMAIITAWWGIWHLFAGFIASQYYAYRVKSSLQTSS